MRAHDFRLAGSLYVVGQVWNDSAQVYRMSLGMSSNNGTSWSQQILWSETSCAYAVAPSPANENIIYVGGERQATDGYYPLLVKTTNKGGSWVKIGDPTVSARYETVRVIECDKTNPNKVLVGTTSGLYMSTDAGSTWTKVVPNQSITSVAFDAANGSLAFCGSASGVRMSTNGGISWSDVTGTMPSMNIQSLEFDGVNKMLYAGTRNGGVFRRSFAGTVDVAETPIAGQFKLFQNYPNPFNPATEISFQLTAVSFVTLTVADILGRDIATLVEGTRNPGSHTARWDASGLPSGVYLCRLQVTDPANRTSRLYSEWRKMILMK